MQYFFGIIINLGLSYLIARFLGKKRQIGFEWSIFFCVSMSPIIGFIITMTSRKYYSDNPSPSIIKKIFGWFFIVFGALALFGAAMEDSRIYGPTFLKVLPQLGIIGLGYYMIQIGKGIRYDGGLVKLD